MKTMDEVIASSKKKKKVKDFIKDIMEMRSEKVSYKEIVAYLAERKVFIKEKSLITIVSNTKKELELEKNHLKKGGTK